MTFFVELIKSIVLVLSLFAIGAVFLFGCVLVVAVIAGKILREMKWL